MFTKFIILKVEKNAKHSKIFDLTTFFEPLKSKILEVYKIYNFVTFESKAFDAPKIFDFRGP